MINMELTKQQKLALLLTVLAASTRLKEVETDLKPSEASKLQTKVLELIEERGEEQAETLVEVDLKEAVRALYEDITAGE